MTAVVVRWYASAAEAAGTAEETVEGTSVAELLASARARHGERLSRVLDVCSVLVDGQRTAADDPRPLEAGATVDVLPPFAGG